jgi:hypothetical protein
MPVLVLLAAVPPAQTRPGPTGMGNMMGTHVIRVTVTGVDTESGMVACNYGTSPSSCISLPPL